MAVSKSRLRLAGLLFVAGLALTGCNPFLLPYIMNPPKQPAEMKHLTRKDKPCKVVVISYAPGADGSPEGVGADRELCRKLVHKLLEATKASKEKIDLVAPRGVEKFKDEHQNWNMDIRAVGEYFKADYVIYLEFDSFDLMESGGLMYRGRAQINVSLEDMHDPVGDPQPQIYKAEFPKRGPTPADDSNISAFRDKFIEYMAEEISWMFVEHDTGSGFAHDD
jgi:hypothetical protein